MLWKQCVLDNIDQHSRNWKSYVYAHLQFQLEPNHVQVISLCSTQWKLNCKNASILWHYDDQSHKWQDNYDAKKDESMYTCQCQYLLHTLSALTPTCYLCTMINNIHIVSKGSTTQYCLMEFVLWLIRNQDVEVTVDMYMYMYIKHVRRSDHQIKTKHR